MVQVTHTVAVVRCTFMISMLHTLSSCFVTYRGLYRRNRDSEQMNGSVPTIFLVGINKIKKREEAMMYECESGYFYSQRFRLAMVKVIPTA